MLSEPGVIGRPDGPGDESDPAEQPDMSTWVTQLAFRLAG